MEALVSQYGMKYYSREFFSSNYKVKVGYKVNYKVKVKVEMAFLLSVRNGNNFFTNAYFSFIFDGMSVKYILLCI